MRLLPGQREAPMPRTENTSAAVVGGCAKVTQFLVGLNLLGRGGESCCCVVSIHEEYIITVPVEREDTQHQYGWLFEKSVRLEKYQM